MLILAGYVNFSSSFDFEYNNKCCFNTLLPLIHFHLMYVEFKNFQIDAFQALFKPSFIDSTFKLNMELVFVLLLYYENCSN